MQVRGLFPGRAVSGGDLDDAGDDVAAVHLEHGLLDHRPPVRDHDLADLLVHLQQLEPEGLQGGFASSALGLAGT